MNSLPPRDTDVLVIYLVRLGGYVALAHAEAQAVASYVGAMLISVR